MPPSRQQRALGQPKGASQLPMWASHSSWARPLLTHESGTRKRQIHLGTLALVSRERATLCIYAIVLVRDESTALEHSSRLRLSSLVLLLLVPSTVRSGAANYGRKPGCFVLVGVQQVNGCALCSGDTPARYVAALLAWRLRARKRRIGSCGPVPASDWMARPRSVGRGSLFACKIGELYESLGRCIQLVNYLAAHQDRDQDAARLVQARRATTKTPALPLPYPPSLIDNLRAG